LSVATPGAARVTKKDYGRLAREVNIHPDALYKFALDGANLSDDILQKLALELTGGHGEFDSETRMMQPVNNAPAIATKVRPEPHVHPDPATGQAIADFKAALQAARPPSAPVRAAPPKPKQSRPGWKDVFV
jgi:hypothetical protein